MASQTHSLVQAPDPFSSGRDPVQGPDHGPEQLPLQQEKIRWMNSMGLDARIIRRYNLLQPGMSDLAWRVMVREALRQHSTFSRGRRKRNPASRAQIPIPIPILIGV